MVKKAFTLLTSILFALTLLMPFNINADTIISANIIGTTVNLINTTKLDEREVTVASGTRMAFNNLFTYDVEVQLDNNYVGYLDLTISGSYYHNLNSLTTMSFSYRRKVFINGDKVNFSIDINTWYSNDPLLRNAVNATPSVILNDSGVTLISELDSIDQIITILQDLYNSSDDIEGLLNNELTQLQLVVSNTSLANQYLDTISKMKQWYFPFESFGIVANSLLNLTQNDSFNLNYWTYPIFTINQGQNAFNQWGDNGQVYYFVFITNTNINTVAQFQSQFTVNDANITVERMQIVRSAWNLVKVTITKVGNGNLQITANQNIPIYIPLYFGQGKYLSTDFALTFGFSNSYLDNINKIANGTVQSNSAASSNDLANEQLKTDSNTLFEQENGFKSDMQSAMKNVNNTFRLQDMGIKFVSSAQWVRTQYEQLTNNTPFASLITFSLITGLALILLGKVYR